MERKIQMVQPRTLKVPKKLRVAAYARVSCGKDAMLRSLSAQISYYSDYIQKHWDWEFAGVYADEAITGTKQDRPQFGRMLEECRKGCIDLILTKSISRFARNTVTLLSTCRELKNMGVGVYFEEQNINTLSDDGELMLSILASYAQEESRSVSENCKWRIRKGFKQGIPSTCHMLGYRLVDGEITVVPEEAEVVQRIFGLYLEGYGKQAICNILNEEGIPSFRGQEWSIIVIRRILEYEKYCGDLILQKYFVSDHLTKERKRNAGQLPQYFVENDHEAIIDREIFQEVQSEIKRRAQIFASENRTTSVFTSLLRCEICGKNYRRKTTVSRIVWCCSTYNQKGKRYCPSKMIPEETLKEACNSVLKLSRFDEESVVGQIKWIEVCPSNRLRFYLRDGHTQDIVWQDRSRSESWTDEMRKKASEYARERRNNNGKTNESHCYSDSADDTDKFIALR